MTVGRTESTVRRILAAELREKIAERQATPRNQTARYLGLLREEKDLERDITREDERANRLRARENADIAEDVHREMIIDEGRL